MKTTLIALISAITICFISSCSSPRSLGKNPNQAVITDDDGYLIPTDMIIFRDELLDYFDAGTLIEVVTNKVGRKAFKIDYQSTEQISPLKCKPLIPNDENGIPRQPIPIVSTQFIRNHPEAYDIEKHGPRGENLPVTVRQYYYPYYYKDDTSKDNRTSE